MSGRGNARFSPAGAGNTRYVWTKNQPNLTARQSAVLDTLSQTKLKTARAWRMRLA